ncbi:MAG TPA: helix-turn-helix domain-containing protein [Pirellulales bacterium]|nr:helix-turn-helix domain-containing protein [Pirellulales bacterium]
MPAAQAPASAITVASQPAVRPAPEPVLLTEAEAADAMRVSLSIVDRLIRNGELPVVRFEQRIVRVRTVDLHAFAERRLVEAGDGAESQKN